MRIDLAPSEDWEKCSESLASRLHPTEGQIVRVHLGTGPGIFEIALMLAQIFSHKRALGFVKGNSPVFDHVTPYFLKEAYAMQATAFSNLNTPEAVTAWVQGLKKETAFVMMAEDNPVTGALAATEELDRQLNERKIFVLRVSHGSHFTQKMETRPYSLRLCAVDETFALSLGGTRLRIPPAFSDRVRWDEADLQSRWQAQVPQEDQKAVEAFENEFKEAKFFKTPAPRVFDRAVLAFEDVSGEALMSRLQKSLNLKSDDVSTANLCDWHSTRLFKGWWENGPTENQLRGLVLFKASLCASKDFAKSVRAVYEELRKQQTW